LLRLGHNRNSLVHLHAVKRYKQAGGSIPPSAPVLSTRRSAEVVHHTKLALVDELAVASGAGHGRPAPGSVPVPETYTPRCRAQDPRWFRYRGLRRWRADSFRDAKI